jgi:Flp pilus assembly protein TadG
MTSAFSFPKPPKGRNLLRDTRGNVAMIWALTATVTLSLVGISIDFSQAHSVKTALQNAADGAALVAERMAERPLSERRSAAEEYFRESLVGQPLAASATVSIEELANGGHRATAQMPSVTTLSRLVTGRNFVVGASSTADQAGSNLEVSLVLDVTGSMAGSRLTSLKDAANDLVDIVVNDEQTPYYTKVSIAPYSVGVNVGASAAAVRGPVTPQRTITNADWRNGVAKNITGATRANPVVVTSAGHGLANGDRVYIANVNGMTQIRNKQFTVAGVTANTFQLSGVNGSGYSNYTNGGTVTKCRTASCEIVVTANAHGFATNDKVFITGVSGMTQINNAANAVWTVTTLDTSNFVLNGTNGPSFTAYAGNGLASCTVAGCEYFRFTNPSNAQRVYRITTCATERTGAEAFTNASPSTAWIGRNYPAKAANCPAQTLMPLTSDKDDLHAKINSLTAKGSTAGQIGIAWGWYLLSPSFGSLWDEESRPGVAGDSLRKVAVIMTDGDFNTTYCEGVGSSDASGVSSGERINCAAPNGNGYVQALQYCTNMKAAGVTVYTVGFDVGNLTAARNLLRDCATGAGYAYVAATGAELEEAFRKIGTSIALLRLTK